MKFDLSIMCNNNGKMEVEYHENIPLLHAVGIMLVFPWRKRKYVSFNLQTHENEEAQ